MTTAVIPDAVRTPAGRRGGRLSGWHPVEPAAATPKAPATRTGTDPVLVADLTTGCVTQCGAHSTNLGRSAVLAAGRRRGPMLSDAEGDLADPIAMPTAPIPATRRLLDRGGPSEEIDVFEANQASASMVPAWQREPAADPDR